MANINTWLELNQQFRRISHMINDKPSFVADFRVSRMGSTIVSIDGKKAKAFYDDPGGLLKKIEVHTPEYVIRMQEDRVADEDLSQVDVGILNIKRRWSKGDNGSYDLQYMSVFHRLGLAEYSRQESGLYRIGVLNSSGDFPEFVKDGSNINEIDPIWELDYTDTLQLTARTARTEELANALNSPEYFIVQALQSGKK